jgi:probable rRNA maturation factor
MASVKQDQDIVVNINEDFKDTDAHLSKLKKLVKAICKRFTKKQTGNTKYEISIAIVDDTQIRKLNNQFLNHKATTDCLSFNLSEDEEKTRIFELVVNGETAVKQANLRKHSSEAELALYITHGLLHNFGFDDSTQSRARKMHDTEDEILQQFGYGPIYNKDIKA